jgi:DNA-binding NtrC family response regulator
LAVIIIEDNEDDLLLMIMALENVGYEPSYTCVQDRTELETGLQDSKWQLVISDHRLPTFNAPEALEVLKESGRNLPIIIVSGTVTSSAALFKPPVKRSLRQPGQLSDL